MIGEVVSKNIHRAVAFPTSVQPSRGFDLELRDVLGMRIRIGFSCPWKYSPVAESLPELYTLLIKLTDKMKLGGWAPFEQTSFRMLAQLRNLRDSAPSGVGRCRSLRGGLRLEHART